MSAVEALVHSRSVVWRGFTVRTAFWFGILVAGYFFVWTFLPLLVGAEVPGDNLEQLDWSSVPDWGYTKHPPLPTWVLWVFERIAPAEIPLTYALGALQVGAMLLVAWLFARTALPWPAQLAAPLLIACISYHTFRMHYYNHNTALLVAYACSVYCTWRVREQGSPWWWVALGLCWGGGMLSKYQMAVPIACNLFYLLTVRTQDFRRIAFGVTIAGTVAALVLAPHFVWLAYHRFPSFQYASTLLGADLPAVDRIRDICSFLAHQLARLGAPLLMLGLLAWQARRNQDPAPAIPEAAADARRFLAIHGFGPLLVMVTLAACFGVDLQSHWGTAFLWVLPLYVISTPFGLRLAMLPVETVLHTAVVVQAVAVLGYVVGL